MNKVKIGNCLVGEGEPVFIIAEIGINHNGSVDVAKKLIDVALVAGCDAVKFQKRTPEICVPLAQRNTMRETPWGIITYMEYREKLEFGYKEYKEIDDYCRQKGILWFASCWDVPSVEFIEQFKPCCYKVASASLTDEGIVNAMRATGRPVMISTGMSTAEEVDHAVSLFPPEQLLIMQSTSTYPCAAEEINLRVMDSYRKRYPCPIGYSGHESGLQISLAAAALGANMIERHITLDRAMWGSDHGASLEPQGLMKLVRDIRIIEKALGDGIKRVYESEMSKRKMLRKS